MISTKKSDNQQRRRATSWQGDTDNPAITSTQYINHQMSLVKTVQKSNRSQLPSKNHLDVSFVDGRLLFENEKVKPKPATQVKNPKKASKVAKKLKIFVKRNRKRKKLKTSPNNVNEEEKLKTRGSLGSASTHILGSSSEDTDKNNSFGFTPMKTRESTETMEAFNFLTQAPDPPMWHHSDLHENVTTISELTMSSPLAAIQKQRERLLTVLGVGSNEEHTELNSTILKERERITTPNVTSRNRFFSCLNGGQKLSSYVSKGESDSQENESSRYSSGSNITDSGSSNHGGISHTEIKFDTRANLRSTSSITSYSSDDGNNFSDDDEISNDESSFDVSTAVSSSMYPGLMESRVVKYSSMAKSIISSVNDKFSDCLAPRFQSP